jgi:hypothetical protein
MKSGTSIWTSTHQLVLSLLLGLGFSAASRAQTLECVPEGWPSEVSYSPGPGLNSGTLSFGPEIRGVAYETGLSAVISQTVTGDHIQLVVFPFLFCGIGIPPKPGRMNVPVTAIAAGQYRVSIELRRDNASASAQNLPLTVTGPAGNANVIPTLSPLQLLALVGVLLAVGLVAVRYRAGTHGI